MAVLPASHRLAGKEKVSIHDLADEHLLQHPEAVPEWQAVATELRDGLRPSFVEARSVEEKLERVAAGRGFSVLPESASRYYQRPDVAGVPIADIPPNEVRLAWVAAQRNPLIAEFVQLAENAVTQAGS